MGPGELTQVPSLDGKCLYLLRSLSSSIKLVFSVSIENLDSAEGEPPLRCLDECGLETRSRGIVLTDRKRASPAVAATLSECRKLLTKRVLE